MATSSDEGGAAVDAAVATDPGGGRADPGSVDPGPPTGEPKVCAEGARKQTKGRAYPFQGVKSPKGDTFTCTVCPTGLPLLQAAWRHFDGDDPTQPPLSKSLDKVVFDGSTFVETIRGIDEELDPTKEITATLEGYLFCPSEKEVTGGELSKFRKIFVLTSVEPAGAFGNHTGDVFQCDILESTSMLGNDILWTCDFDWDGTVDAQIPYCKVGSTVQGKDCLAE